VAGLEALGAFRYDFFHPGGYFFGRFENFDLGNAHRQQLAFAVAAHSTIGVIDPHQAALSVHEPKSVHGGLKDFFEPFFALLQLAKFFVLFLELDPLNSKFVEQPAQFLDRTLRAPIFFRPWRFSLAASKIISDGRSLSHNRDLPGLHSMKCSRIMARIPLIRKNVNGKRLKTREFDPQSTAGPVEGTPPPGRRFPRSLQQPHRILAIPEGSGAAIIRRLALSGTPPVFS
jgi:hypothetical protein